MELDRLGLAFRSLYSGYTGMQIVFMLEKVKVLPGSLNCIMGFSSRKLNPGCSY